MRLSGFSGALTGIITAVLAAFLVPAEALSLDVIHHEIDAELWPSTHELVCIDRLTIDPEAADAEDPLRFLLHKDLDVISVTSGQGYLTWEDTGVFDPRHFWDRPDYSRLDAYEFAKEIVISGIPKDRPAQKVEITITYGGVIYDSLKSPDVPYARSFQTTLGLIDERGTYLGGASFWYPSTVEDLFTFELRVVTPSNWLAVSQGALSSLGHADNGAYVHWVCEDLMEEIYLVAGPYLMKRENHHGVDVMTFTYDDDEELTSRYIEGTKKYLDMYSGLLGQYPFPKFALVENFWQTGFGMPSFTLLGDRVIRLPFILDTSYGHEILHNWWGNSVYVDMESGNWCEGLTTYGADHLYKEAKSEEEARDYRLGLLRSYRDYVTGERDFPLTDFRERESSWTQAVGYGKSTMVFHMIRRMIGTENYWRALRSFYSEFKFRQASWSDLMGSFEKTSGSELEWFEKQWVEKPGAPVIRLGEVSVNRSGELFDVDFTIEQASPSYKLSLPIRIATEGGDLDFVMDVSDTIETFTISVPSEPKALELDPDVDVFRRLHREEIPPTLSQTLGADSSLIIVSESEELEMSRRLRDLAETWADDESVFWDSEREVSEIPPDMSVWFLGRTAFADEFARHSPQELEINDSGCRIGDESYTLDGKSAVFTISSPYDPEHSWTLILSGDPAGFESVGAKLPHYGKYSYLIFDGSTNIGKGIWRVEESPLRVKL
jgi:hypothetical protein